MGDKKILDKVKKLLALSESPNVHEAAVAASMAQKLIIQYKIDQSKLNQGPTSEIVDMFRQTKQFIDSFDHNIPTWKDWLFTNLSKHNFCFSYVVGTPDKKYFNVLGTQEDIDLIKFLYAHFVSEIERLSKSNTKGKGKSFSTNFKEGAVIFILKALKKNKEEMSKEATTGSAIILLDKKYDEAKKASEKYSLAKRGEKRDSFDLNARREGYDAANQIDLLQNKKLKAEDRKLSA